MATYDIKKHFSGIRAQTSRRRDPFAETFDDDNDESRKSRTKNKAPAVAKPAAPPKTSIASPFASLDALRDSDDDFLDAAPTKRSDRRPSPAPAKLAAQRVIDASARRGSLPGALPSTDPRKAAVLAAGPLAYLDDSSEEDQVLRPRRKDRARSPAPRKTSDNPSGRSQTPRGDKLNPKDASPKLPVVAPPKHTVASPFAGTKYLQDSDSDEEAVTSRQNSVDSATSTERKADGAKSNHLEVKRVDKPKQNGGGVSWRAFSAGRAEQRYAEIEALQASFRKRGRTISFSSHATTDDGKRVPLSPTSERGPGPLGRARGKSPPRRSEDTRPDIDEVVDRVASGGGAAVGVYDPTQYKTNPFTGEPVRRTNSDCRNVDFKRPEPFSPGGSLPDIRIDDISQQ